MKYLFTKNRKRAVVDDKFEYLKSYKWHLSNGYFATTLCFNGKNQEVYLHRLVTSCLSVFEVDHANRNKLDNRLVNLRVCTRSLNSANKIKNKNNTSGYKGVYFMSSGKRIKKWRACLAGKTIGYFLSKKEAKYAYDKEAKQKYGEFSLS